MPDGKVWGETAGLFASESVSVHYLRIVQGGYCSKHLHHFKFNVFHVVRGAVAIREWPINGDDRPDETTLRAGQGKTISPQRWHEFEALEESEMIEIYFAGLSPDPDIERMNSGGVRCVAEQKAKKRKSE